MIKTREFPSSFLPTIDYRNKDILGTSGKWKKVIFVIFLTVNCCNFPPRKDRKFDKITSKNINKNVFTCVTFDLIKTEILSSILNYFTRKIQISCTNNGAVMSVMQFHMIHRFAYRIILVFQHNIYFIIIS
jgi:hypothetical protein